MSDKRMVEHDGQWYFEIPLPDMTDYSGPFLGGTAKGLTMRGCTMLLPTGIGVWHTEDDETTARQERDEPRA